MILSDYIVRATAKQAQIRAFAITSRELVETARQKHNTSPVVTAALGRLLSAGAMMGSMLKADTDILTLQVKGDGPMHGLTSERLPVQRRVRDCRNLKFLFSLVCPPLNNLKIFYHKTL